jgi:CO/xanthine dehydrogenase Mo-binding subunit
MAALRKASGRHFTSMPSTNARLVTGSFMDYTMPRADMLPKFEIALEEVRCGTEL